MLVLRIAFIFLASTETWASNCCRKVYLFASEAISDRLQPLLGIYGYAGQHAGRPYYSKKVVIQQSQIPGDVADKQFFLAYTENGNVCHKKVRTYVPTWLLSIATYGRPSGWLVAAYVYGKEPLIFTNTTEFPKCPVGLTQGFTFSVESSRWYLHSDPTFAIECHRDEVADPCGHCKTLNVNSTGAISSFHPVRIGNYVLNGTFNGHPAYRAFQHNFTSYLYFRKDGK